MNFPSWRDVLTEQAKLNLPTTQSSTGSQRSLVGLVSSAQEPAPQPPRPEGRAAAAPATEDGPSTTNKDPEQSASSCCSEHNRALCRVTSPIKNWLDWPTGKRYSLAADKTIALKAWIAKRV